MRPRLRRPPRRTRPRVPASATVRAGAGTCPEGSVAVCATRRMPSTCCAPTRAARGCCAPSRRATACISSAAPCATCCSERAPRELDLVVEGDVDAAAARLGGEVTAHDRFGTARVRAGDCAYDLVRARAETYAHPGALPDVRPGTLDEDLARRDVTVNAIALRPRRCAERGRRRARGSARPAACACCTTRRSSTTRRASGAWRATRRAWASTVEERTRALAGRRRPGDRERRPPRGRAAPGAQRARSARRAAGRRASSTPPTCPTGFDPRPRALAAALDLLPAEGRADLLTLAACTRRDGRPRAAGLARRHGLRRRRARPGGGRLALLHGRAAARRAHQRRDRAGGAGRADRGGRAGRRRERAALAGRAAPRAPGHQRRRPAARRRSRRGPRSARGCSARWTASSTASSPAASRSWPLRWARTVDRLAAR